MTAEERQARRQAKQEADARRGEIERADKDLILQAMRSILTDTAATAGQKLYAFAVLCHMQYYSFAPYNLPYPDKPKEIDLSRLRGKFAAELAAAQTSDR